MTTSATGRVLACRTFCLSSTFLAGGKSASLGQRSGVDFNHSGPFHYRSCRSNSEGNIPREAQSAGLSGFTTWFQRSGAMRSTMQETWLPKLCQLRTIVLSVQAYTHFRGNSKDTLHVVKQLSQQVCNTKLKSWYRQSFNGCNYFGFWCHQWDMSISICVDYSQIHNCGISLLWCIKKPCNSMVEMSDSFLK